MQWWRCQARQGQCGARNAITWSRSQAVARDISTGPSLTARPAFHRPAPAGDVARRRRSGSRRDGPTQRSHWRGRPTPAPLWHACGRGSPPRRAATERATWGGWQRGQLARPQRHARYASCEAAAGRRRRLRPRDWAVAHAHGGSDSSSSGSGGSYSPTSPRRLLGSGRCNGGRRHYGSGGWRSGGGRDTRRWHQWERCRYQCRGPNGGHGRRRRGWRRG